MDQQPLSGIRVVDLTHVLAGPYCTYLLGLLGAEIIKVEIPGGEMGRWMAPPGPLRDAGLGAAFLAQVAGKRMLAVDIRKPEGAEVLPSWRNPPKLPGEARRYRQLILTVRSPFTEGQDVGVLGAETWRLADLGAKHALLLAGSGWGLMPEPVVRDDLASARLVRLDLPEARGGFYPLQAIYRTDNPPGPAPAGVIQRFVSQSR